MTLNEAIERYTSNAEYERIHGNLQGCLDFRQLAEWLKDYERLLKQEPKAGHWEQYGNFWEEKFKCSECGKEQPKILCGERIIGHWSDYCPNCGCRMVEPQERNGEE